MEISPAAGKILGMLMAYAVSSLGLLLAYYNYRKRIIKAEKIFSATAKAVIIGVVSVAVVGAMLTAVAATAGGAGLWRAVQDNALGLLLPLIIVLVSVMLTWILYRHFSHQLSDESAADTEGE
jgi:ABC-type polysaccharide transport system permease subunit